ncbi:helix-turn-helix transcriptional regulator [Calothrix sp. FACHB-1219]|uniref:helix-turn-helix domain-containing protein n=1 Tax=unclassified Calothrix TaxID=2619626 RepID=UPI000B5EB58D|nr:MULTISPECIES: helix-turn-helix transcriptional regulator [unclassified Calothrix]MBD2202691.1 helix-turn-helix transcriptional regulator [Calothrix sp. FACHB-168]MBD2218844.1 helix-turn-helix transcriptional regulator [Calothrix sp. FACHB-1219]BAY29739.1 helix-turn-helix domain protein [Nostoc carneum NIES-2107]
MKNDLTVHCKIKDLMDSQGISQLRLAEETGLSPGTIGRLYRNQVSRIDSSTLVALAKYFGLKSVSQIIEFEIG